MKSTTTDNWPGIGPDEKAVPGDAALRRSLRRAAVDDTMQGLNGQPPERYELVWRGRRLLSREGTDRRYLAYAVIASSNALWGPAFASVPFDDRLLLLPTCLRHTDNCPAPIDAEGLHCRQCGACAIGRIRQKALDLGYEVMVAEGTPPVLKRLIEGRARAVLGVACMDSLEKVSLRFDRFAIPHIAVPLLRDGCCSTAVDEREVMDYIETRTEMESRPPRTVLPLMKAAVRLFDPDRFDSLIGPAVSKARSPDGDAFGFTESIALDWLRRGGKRLRPFVTLVAYAVARDGRDVLYRDRIDLDGLPTGVCRLALGIESLHKASLVHDDIEDDDPYRYGVETLHRQYGTGQALNIGDYLVGLGYRLITASADDLGADTAAAIVARMAAAHQDLCRGQGTELHLDSDGAQDAGPLDILSIYALKTSPAFEAALYAGLRAAGPDHVPDDDTLHRFCIYLGEGYQVLNDLYDWESDDRNKRVSGRDVVAGRPTLLRAFALQAGWCDRIDAIVKECRNDEDALVLRMAEAYESAGAFEKARGLLGKLRERARNLAATLPSQDTRELFESLIRILM